MVSNLEPLDADRWVDVAASMGMRVVTGELLCELSRRLCGTHAPDPQLVGSVVSRLGSIKPLRDQLGYLPEFWEPLARVVPLPPTERGGKFDVTSAAEEHA